MFMTGGILFGHRALRPGQPVYLQRELHKARVEATTEQIHKAVEMLRRRGLHIVARPRHPGYRLQSWLMPTMTWSEQQADDDLLPPVAEADHKGGQSDGQK
jgi:biotin operon repressor